MIAEHLKMKMPQVNFIRAGDSSIIVEGYFTSNQDIKITRSSTVVCIEQKINLSA